MTMKLILSNGMECSVDDLDYERFCHLNWHVTAKAYPASLITVGDVKVKIYLHRLVAGAAPWEFVDHAHGDTLNATRANLRLCTHAENIRNSQKRLGKSSTYKGVVWDKRRSKWRVRITHDSRRIEIGLFNDEVAGARAYDDAAISHFGRFARLNFPIRKGA